MKLESQDKNNLCDICIEAAPDPQRDDNLCGPCGNIADKYTEDEDTINLGKDE